MPRTSPVSSLLIAAALSLVLGPLAMVSRGQEHAEHSPAAHADAHHAAGAAHPAAGEHGGHENAGHDEHGEYSIWSDLPFWSGIAFLGFLFAIKKLGLWNLLLSSMSEREQTENEAIAMAEADLTEALSTLRQSRGRLEALDEQIRETMAEAKRDATHAREEIIRHGEIEAQAAVNRATNEIERVRDHSLNDLFATLADKVMRVTERKLVEGLQADDHARLIESTFNQLQIH